MKVILETDKEKTEYQKFVLFGIEPDGTIRRMSDLKSIPSKSSARSLADLLIETGNTILEQIR